MSLLFVYVYYFNPNVLLSDLLYNSNLKNVIFHNISLSSNSGFTELNSTVVNEIVGNRPLLQGSQK
jgi:hypothetical protein